MKLLHNAIIADITRLTWLLRTVTKDDVVGLIHVIRESSQRNVDIAKQCPSLVPLPWLGITCRNKSSFNTATECTHLGSVVPACLFNLFHEENVKKEAEILRRLTCLKNLARMSLVKLLLNIPQRNAHFFLYITWSQSTMYSYWDQYLLIEILKTPRRSLLLIYEQFLHRNHRHGRRKPFERLGRDPFSAPSRHSLQPV